MSSASCRLCAAASAFLYHACTPPSTTMDDCCMHNVASNSCESPAADFSFPLPVSCIQLKWPSAANASLLKVLCSCLTYSPPSTSVMVQSALEAAVYHKHRSIRLVMLGRVLLPWHSMIGNTFSWNQQVFNAKQLLFWLSLGDDKGQSMVSAQRQGVR